MPRHLLIILAIFGGMHSAHAHGIAGNRFFPGTLSFDDPAVADEAILPNFASFKRPTGGGNVVDNNLSVGEVHEVYLHLGKIVNAFTKEAGKP